MVKDVINDIRKISLTEMLAKNIRTLRKKHKLSQNELAKLTGIARTTIGRYECCMHRMSLDHLLLIARALGESPATLLEGWEDII